MTSQRRAAIWASAISFRRCQKASTSIEFAFVLLPMLWLIIAMIEIGLLLTAQYELQNAVLDTSRKIRTGITTSATPATLKSDICAKVVLVRDCSSKLRIEARRVSSEKFSDLQSVMSDPLTLGPSSPEVVEIGTPDRPGSLIATYDWQFILPLVGWLSSNVTGDSSKRRLHGVAVFKIEKYS